MNSKNSSDILKKLINEMKNSKSAPGNLSKEDIKNKISKIDKNQVITKLNSMGLGSVADKLGATSDAQIIDFIGKNPSVLSKINDFLKKGE